MALTVQSIFDTITAIDNERSLAAGGDEVTTGLIIVATVTKWLESEASLIEGVLATHDLLYTAENVETTDWPTELMRLDALWYIDTNTARPVYKIEKIQGIGNHTPGLTWPYSPLMFGSSSSVTGKPREYAGSGPGGQFYWAPLPDDEYIIRAYGLWAAPDNFYADASTAFPYPSTLRLPFAAMCDRLFRTGLDRDTSEIKELAGTTFRKELNGLARFNQDGPDSRVYSEVHDA